MKYFSVLLFIITPSLLFSQSRNELEFVEASFFIHSISLPFQASNKMLAFNRLPGLKVGTSIITNENNGLRYSFRPSVSVYYQKKLHRAININTEACLSYIRNNRFFPEIGVGVGYLHTFEDAPIYSLKSGSYSQKRDWGRSQFTIPMGLGAGWFLSKNLKMALTIQHQVLMQWPFATKGGARYILHNRTQFGLRKYLDNNRK